MLPKETKGEEKLNGEVQKQKARAASLSITASTLLTVLKLAIGLLTNSIAVFSLAVDSFFDIAGSATAFLSIRASNKPPDPDHLYGHGKTENLGGLVVTSLLLITVVYLVYNALERILLGTVQVVPGVIGFAGIITAIVFELWVSRYLKHIAMRSRSEILEANALQFRMDIWTQSLVIVGLVFVNFGLGIADPVMAILVSCYIAFLGVRTGKKAIDVLLDRAPSALVKKIRESLEGVKYDKLRVRASGSQTFADMRIHVPMALSTEKAHSLASEVESRVKTAVPGVDVVIHIEADQSNEKAADRIRRIAMDIPGIRGVHDVWVRRIDNIFEIDIHMQVDADLLLSEAHRVSTLFEEVLRKEFGRKSKVTVHIDTEVDQVITQPKPEVSQSLVLKVKETALGVEGVTSCDHVALKNFDGVLHVSVSCTLKHDVKVKDAHKIAEGIEERVAAKVGASKVFVHAAPPESE